MKLLNQIAFALGLLLSLQAAVHAQSGRSRNVNANNGNGAFNKTFIQNKNTAASGGLNRNMNINNGNGAFNKTLSQNKNVQDGLVALTRQSHYLHHRGILI